MEIKAEKLHDYFIIGGRTYLSEGMLFMSHTLSFLEGRFTGTLCFTLLTDYEKDKHSTFVKVFIDNKPKKYKLKRGENTLKIETTDGEHTFKLIKLSESKRNFLAVKSVCAAKFIKIKNSKTLNLEFIGDSITAGYGIMSKEVHGKYFSKHQDPTYAFPYKVATALNANFNVIASSGHGLGKTKDADASILDLYKNVDLYTNQQPWDESNFVPNIEIIELGINDFLYFQNLEDDKKQIAEFEDKFVNFVQEFLRKKRKIILVYGFFGLEKLKISMENIYKRLNSKDVYLVHTLDIGTIADLHAWHPGRRSHTITANKILKVIKENNLA